MSNSHGNQTWEKEKQPKETQQHYSQSSGENEWRMCVISSGFFLSSHLCMQNTTRLNHAHPALSKHNNNIYNKKNRERTIPPSIRNISNRLIDWSAQMRLSMYNFSVFLSFNHRWFAFENVRLNRAEYFFNEIKKKKKKKRLKGTTRERERKTPILFFD